VAGGAAAIKACFVPDAQIPDAQIPGSQTDSKFRFDLPGYVKLCLMAAGAAHITDCGEDTYAPSSTESPRFFSHRRATHTAATDTGRQLSIISLTAPSI
jgi:copper oxidase (laccase) domain-containing protein